MDANKPRTSDGQATPASRGRSALRNPLRAWSKTLVAFSVVYIGLLGVYVWLLIEQRMDTIALPPPSSVGDFLAGVFSPLAFLWLVYGYLLQSAELELQRDEIASMREAQEDQARHLARAADAQEREAALADQAHRIGTEPEIEIEHRGFSGGRLKLSIVNHGATARSLEFYSVANGWNVSPSPLGGRALRTDEAIALEASNGEASQESSLRFELTYRSATNIALRRKAFEIAPDGKVNSFSFD